MILNKKYNFVYKTTNLCNGKIYIGVHSTNKLDDGYIGSGSLFLKSVDKYGYDNFSREILKFFDNYADAYKYESELVTETFVKENDNYNLRTGGLDSYKASEEVILKSRNSQRKRFSNPEERKKVSIRQKKFWSIPENRERMLREICNNPERNKKLSNSIKKYIEENQEEFQARVLKINKDPEKIRKMAEKHRGMKRTDETKKNQSDSKKRFIEANGTEWTGKGCVYIHNPTTGERKRVSSDFVIPDGWKTGLGKQNKKKPSGVNMYIKNMELMIEKVVPKDSEIPNGWILGRLKK